MKKIVCLCWLGMLFNGIVTAQVDTSHVYNTSTPFGTLDIRIAKSSTRYYYLQENKTISFRESPPGVKTNTYLNMTSWDSSPYAQGNMREKSGSSDYFIMNYRLLFPSNYNASYSPGYPLIVMMHGAGERANCWDSKCYHADRSWNYQTNNPPAPTSADHQLLNNDHNLLHGGKPHLDARNAAGSRLPNDPSMPTRAFPGFVLFPQNLNGWTGSTVQDAIRLVRLVAKKYKIDPNRIYIHGLSNGGVGTYEAIKRAPWLFAAALPMSSPSDASTTATNIVGRVSHIPLWLFQGGIDPAPTPAKTEGYIKKFREAGAIVRYSFYSHLGHGVWNTAYKEPDFFKWILAQNKTKLHVFANVPSICKTNGKGVKMELAAGFYKYQWERNGVIISGATSATYVATTPGVYRARFSRVPNPSEGQWNPWSQSVTVTEQSPAQAQVEQIGTVLLKDLNSYGNAHLKSTSVADHYYWYKNGSLVNLAGTVDDTVRFPIFKQGDCTSNCTGNGNYTLVMAGYDNCPSPPSKPITIYFNNQAPINITAPTNFNGQASSGSNVKLTWTDASSNEHGFEIWRRKVISSSTFSKWEMAVLTNSNVATYTDVGLVPSTTYHYKIRAVSSSGRSNYTPSSSSSYLVVTTGGDTTPPSAPQNLTASQSGIGVIKLSWSKSTDNLGVKEYVVYYGSSSVATGSPNNTYELKNLPINNNYSITVKAKDFANNLSAASNAASANTFVTGLYYEHSTGAWSNINSINWNIAEFKGKVNNFTLSPRTQEDYFNFKYDGYLYISSGGTYQFRTTSSDGSRVELNGTIVVDNDGLHDSKTVTGSTISLTSGAKRIIVKYFEFDGSQSLSVKYKGPDTNGTWINIPDAALRSSGGSSSALIAGVESEDEEVMEEVTQEAAVAVFPNPATQDNLNVQMEATDESPVQIRLMDFTGRSFYDNVVLADDIRNGVKIDPNQTLMNGLYVVVLQQNGKVVKKVIAIKN